jgi:RimJ/RimL family protein N-acetyltransferase
MEITLENYDENFLELSWNWLNDPEIKHLTNSINFTKQEQLIWYKKIPEKSDYLIWGVKIDNFPIGVCGIKKIKNQKAEYWGYIGEKEYWGKGIGRQIINKIEIKALALNIKTLNLKVIKTNHRAIALYIKMGFHLCRNHENELEMTKEISNVN